MIWDPSSVVLVLAGISYVIRIERLETAAYLIPGKDRR